MRQTVLLAVALLAAVFCGAGEFELSGVRDSASWSFFDGPEYPGAKGSVADGDGGVSLQYDFSGGGRYVGVKFLGKLFGTADAFAVGFTPAADGKLSLRLTDARGRMFQTRPEPFKAGTPALVRCPVAGPFLSSWGGDKNITTFTPPVKSVMVLIHADEKSPKSGAVAITSLRCSAPETVLPKADDFQWNGGGWEFSGTWSGRPDGLLLQLTAKPGKDAQLAQLALTFPFLLRDKAWRFELDPAAGERRIDQLIGAELCGNPFNRYTLKLELTGDGFASARSVALTGAGYAALDMERFYTSAEISESMIGTQVHFAYGDPKSGTFGGYADYRRLTDLIAAAGFKYIRDTVLLEKDEQGGYRVRQKDLEWIRYAREKGIKTIAIFRLYADDPVEEYLKKVDAMVRDTRDLLDIYELGNEPFGQGGWRQKHGGPWNGKEKDNSTSPWVVAHCKYTNAIADRFKKIYPAATIIGIGANTPTNYRYFDIGVTPNLDGVVDHPYSYCLPPEKVPYGWNYEKRDGVRVGDKENSFAGMVADYHRKFKESGKDRSLWLTECGYTTYWWDGTNEKGFYGGYTEEAQAVYLVRRFVEAVTLDIAAVVQYCFLDKFNSRTNAAEGNFGLIRHDFSFKPSYLAFRRLNSRLNGFRYAPEIKVKITAEPLHRGNRRAILVRDWDDVQVDGDNGCMVLPFRNRAGEVIVAVWSKQPYAQEFNSRTLSFRLEGCGAVDGAIAQDAITGINYDIPWKNEAGIFSVDAMTLRQNPLYLRLVKTK